MPEQGLASGCAANVGQVYNRQRLLTVKEVNIMPPIKALDDQSGAVQLTWNRVKGILRIINKDHFCGNVNIDIIY
jgi:hypothetical protein